MELLSAGICRDGGSIAVDFRLPDETFLSILLEVTGDLDEDRKRVFGHLHIGSAIQNGCDRETIVVQGSATESELLAALDAWLQATPAPSEAEERTRRCSVVELREHIPLRTA